MSEIELSTCKPKIFDDPVYCFDQYKSCFYFEEYTDSGNAWCNLFPCKDDKNDPTTLFRKGKCFRFIKCEECKKHYNLSKHGK